MELICQENPWVVGGGADGLREGGNQVSFRASLTQARSDLVSRRHFEVGSPAVRAVTNGFVLLALALAGLACDAGLHRVGSLCAFQRLDAGLLSGADQLDALRLQGRSLLLKIAPGVDWLVNLRWISSRGVEPGFNPIRLEIDLMLKTARHGPGRGFRRSGG